MKTTTAPLPKSKSGRKPAKTQSNPPAKRKSAAPVSRVKKAALTMRTGWFQIDTKCACCPNEGIHLSPDNSYRLCLLHYSEGEKEAW